MCRYALPSGLSARRNRRAAPFGVPSAFDVGFFLRQPIIFQFINVEAAKEKKCLRTRLNIVVSPTDLSFAPPRPPLS